MSRSQAGRSSLLIKLIIAVFILIVLALFAVKVIPQLITIHDQKEQISSMSSEAESVSRANEDLSETISNIQGDDSEQSGYMESKAYDDGYVKPGDRVYYQ